MQGFGLQIGSDFYLLLDRQSRHQLDALASSLSTTVALTGSWVADNATVNNSIPLIGTWTFSHAIPPSQRDIYNGCHRPKNAPWYLQGYPLWTSFIIVPLFSTLSSLANLQPLKSKQLPVMVVISCASYASNKIANHYIFNRSDVVSAIGAFTVGVLGNAYSRKMGGTAFTSMVTGVLFLVPVCFACIIRSDLLTGLVTVVWFISSRRHHCERQWYRYRRCDDSRHNRNHCWSLHESSLGVCIWHS